MATPIDTENLRAVFKGILQKHQLKPEDVKEQRSCIAVSDMGAFQCESCPNSWRSNFSWLTFDLRNLEIKKRWKMKCRECMVTSIPTFTVAQLESMFEKVVRFYKGEDVRPVRDIGYRGRRTYRMPHHPNLCEKCRWGLEQCWSHKFYV